MTRSSSLRGWWIAPPLLLIAVFFYYPLVHILGLGFGSADAVSFELPKLVEVVWFTLWQALVSAALSVAVGLVFAYLFYRRSFLFVRTFRALSLIPFAAPVLLTAIAVESLHLEKLLPSIAWIIAVHVLINAPLTIHSVGSFWASMGNEIEEAAELDGAGRFKTFLSISFPNLRPAIVTAFASTAVFCASSFGVILFFGSTGTQTIETLIYRVSTAYLDLRGASILALCQLALVSILFAASRLLRGSRLQTQGDLVHAPKLDNRDFPVLSLGFILGLLAVVPYLQLLLANNVNQVAFWLDQFGLTPEPRVSSIPEYYILGAIFNSLRNGLIVATLATVIGGVAGYILARIGIRWPRYILNLAYVIPLGVSSVVLGFGYLVSFDAPPIELRASWLIVPVAQTVMAVPLVVTLVANSVSAIDAEVLDASATDGATLWQRFRYVELPLITPTLIAAASFAAVIAIGDFGASSFLAFGDQETLPQMLFRYFSHPGSNNFSFAIITGNVLLAITALPMLLFSLLTVRSRSR